MRITEDILLPLFVLSILGCQRNTSTAPKDQTASNKAETQNTSSVQDWLIQESANKMDNTPEVTLAKLPEDGASDRALAIRCVESRTEVLVSTGTVLSDPGEVRVRFDDAKPLRQRWGRSSDHVALFAPNGLEFARELATHESFLIEVSPLDERPRTQEYRLAGLDKMLPKIAAACNWKGIDRARAAARTATERARSANAALEKTIRDKLSSFIEPCREKWMFPGKWCWYDANDSFYSHGSQGFESRELALQDAVNKAKSGRAFQSEMSRLNQQ